VLVENGRPSIIWKDTVLATNAKSSPKAVVSPKAVERIKSGHLWIYRGDVLESDGSAGSIVSVLDKKGRYCGRAFYSSTSLIALRLLTSSDERVDRLFWVKRLQQALELRRRVVSDTEVYRLVNGEGDGLPSIIVDCYGETLSLQTLSQGAEQVKPILLDILRELLAPKAIVERNDPKVRDLEGLPRQVSILHGTDPGEFVCRESSLYSYYQPTTGQKTGAFLDQRENRAWTRTLAHGSALDCFCYTGGFAAQMALSCKDVEAVDVSEPALETARRVAKLNHLDNIRFELDNVFDRLRLYGNLKKRFDTIVLDPPAFAKNRNQLESALRGYREINLRALRLLNPGGLLVTTSCSQVIDEITFLNLLSNAAAEAKRRVQVVQKRTQSQDHPFLLSMPETYYLKCLFLRVLY
jgi:23S rRNA (cytosine1962-C5)-methyltransferase